MTRSVELQKTLFIRYVRKTLLVLLHYTGRLCSSICREAKLLCTCSWPCVLLYNVVRLLKSNRTIFLGPITVMVCVPVCVTCVLCVCARVGHITAMKSL